MPPNTCTVYTCLRCSFSTRNKGDADRHIQRVTLCTKTNIDWPDDEPARYERIQTRKEPRSTTSVLTAKVDQLTNLVTRLVTDGVGNTTNTTNITNNNNNTTNNTMNNNITNNNITANICVFGHEDTSHITAQAIADLVNSLPTTEVLPGVIDMIYYNKHGKNFTFILPRAGQETALVRKQAGWECMPVDNVVQQVTYKGVDVMQQSVDSRNDKFIGNLVPEETMDEYDDHCCDLYNAAILLHLNEPDVIENRKKVYNGVHGHLLDKQNSTSLSIAAA